MQMTCNRKNKVKMCTSDRIFTGINGLFLAIFFGLTLYPMAFVLFASISDPNAVATGKMVFWPVGTTWDGYKYILNYSEIWLGYINTFFYTFFGTLINLAVTLPCAYALSRPEFKLKGVVMGLFIFTMYFNGGMIPNYLNIQSLGLINTRWALLLPGAVAVYNLIVARTFFSNTIPWELHEAAFLDGCKDYQLLLHVVLPLSMPIVVVMTLYYGVGHWNSYFSAMIYLQDRKLYPLQVFLREILLKSQFASSVLSSGEVMSAEELAYMTKESETADLIKYGVIVVSTVPMLIVYPWMQKYFSKGVMIGSVKG